MKFLKMLIEICFEESINTDTISALFKDVSEKGDKLNDVLSLVDILHQEQQTNSLIAIQNISDILGVDSKYLKALYMLSNMWEMGDHEITNELKIAENLTNISESLQIFFPNCKDLETLTHITIYEVAEKIHSLLHLEVRVSSLSEKL